MKLYVSLSIARQSPSVTSTADISGWRSYVATLGLGTSKRSSFGNGCSTPPLKKNVTCGYFSVSAVWNCRIPAWEMTSETPHASEKGGNAIGYGKVSSYCVMVASVRRGRA